jgi:multidrug efflux system membrane fusion protein
MIRIARTAVLGLLTVFVSFTLNGCTKEEVSAQTSRDSAAPVTVATVTQRDVPVQIRSIASVEAFLTVTIKSRVAGQLQRVHVSPGQEVKKGDPLFEIDPRPFEIALKEAQAQLERDSAMAKNAQIDSQRMSGLLAQNAATREEADKMRFAFEAAEATVRADQAAIENANLRIEYAKIRSPIDGRAGSFMSDLGNVLKADETELVVINQVRPIYVTFNVPEVDLQQVRKYLQSGQPPAVHVVIPPDEEPTESGKLSFIDNTVDKETGTIRLKATFANEDRRLWPGTFVQAIMDLTVETGAVLVPSRAVQTGQNGLYVFVVQDDMTAQMRPVKVRRTIGEESLLEPGAIEAGQRVVTDGHLRVKPGAKVQIKQTSSTAPTTEPSKPALQGRVIHDFEQDPGLKARLVARDHTTPP